MADASNDVESFSKVWRKKKSPNFKFQTGPASHQSAGRPERRSSQTSASLTSIDEELMSSNGVETMSTHSSTPQTSGGSQTQASTRGKQPARRRKTYHGILFPHRAFLIPDRLKPQTKEPSEQENKTPAPRKPPGLSTPPESVSGTDERPTEEDESDCELCFICGNSMKDRYYSLAPCNNAF